MKTIFRLTALLLVLLTAVEAESGPSLALKIGTLPIADTLLLHVAQREGFFAEEGLTVELIPFQGFVEKSAAVQSGELDGHFGEISAVIIGRASHLPFVAVAATSHTNPASRMFGLVTSPKCRAEDLAALEGLSLGTSRLAIVDFLADVLFEKHGRRADFMKRKNLAKIPVRMQMLTAGQIDAAVLPEPLLSIAEKAGGRVILDDCDLNMPLAVVALREDLATAANVRAFRAALVKAGRAINEKPAHYRALLLELRLIPPQLADDFTLPPVDLDLIPHSLPSRELYQDYLRWLIKNKALSENGAEAGGPPPAPAYEEVVWQDPSGSAEP